MKKLKLTQSGFLLPTVLVFGGLLLAFAFAIGTISISNLNLTTHEQNSAEALQIAEAGVNYYLWHLTRDPSDYQDGTGAPANAPYGPYIHTYTNISGTALGTFTLTIIPPPNGSTIATIISTGSVNGFQGTRTIKALIGEPSFASYVLLTNTEVWFGSNESTDGPVHSNVGVHMDGTNNGTVESSNATYTPSSEFGGDGRVHNGVWGNGGPTSEWQFPVPTINFTQLTVNVSSMETAAQSSGVYLPPSGQLGYDLQLQSNGSINIYTVKSENNNGITTTFLRNQAAPSNGILFANDDVWISGTGYAGRITVVAGRLPANPSTYASINITGNLTYAAKDGSDAIGLIAQNNIQVSNYSPKNLEIDGALLAQNGHVWVQDNAPVNTNLTFYGAIATDNYWTWNWVNSYGQVTNGYQTDSNTFDTNLLYAPPPSYPTTGTFEILSWREVLDSP